MHTDKEWKSMIFTDKEKKLWHKECKGCKERFCLLLRTEYHQNTKKLKEKKIAHWYGMKEYDFHR